ncbi:hypothetical protein [Staphylococcus cohnii]|uniref:hypothetical protein n=1 Tax=Staphylococcus cohnii TaxID=29382 RepID=UPI0011073707|nr:hypothetical protein [Staphylococcus cohnii]TLW35988.1 hypothetical protein FFX88_08810 [Staphylococcus cohnii]
MARKEITTPLDLNNMNNHNQNYKELYNEIQTTDKRLSENMWEEIKGANTMKMLEPVQTADQLPATAEDKSLITVIEEQRVYAYVHDEWQPFSEIDLDPFEPFKKELAEIVSTYEAKIQSITQEVQSTKDSAIGSIESTQSQSESNIEDTKQTAINSVNKAQREAESQIGETTEALKGKTSELTTMFNDYLEQLTSKQDTALVEVENAKQDALDALNAFQSVDTSDWQKHKLTEDDGYIPRIDNADMSDLDSFMEINSKHVYLFDPINTPMLNDDNGYLTIIARSSTYAQAIFSPINNNTVYMNNKIGSSNGWDGWEPVGGTKVVLFEGSLNGVGSTINLKDDMYKYSALIISGSIPGGTFNELVLTSTMGSDVSIQKLNLRNSNGQFLGIYEVNLNVKDNQTLEVTNDVSWDEVNASGSGEGRDAYSFIYVEGWK